MNWGPSSCAMPPKKPVMTCVVFGTVGTGGVGVVVLAMVVMLFASKGISDFVNARPTVKMLALAFLLLIGVVLVADGLGQHVPKGYIYFAMAFSFGVELLNLKLRRKKTEAPVALRKEY